MDCWAASQPHHVRIDWGLYLPNSTQQEIPSLQLSLGGMVANLSTADSGMSILICRACSTKHKTALKWQELAEDRMWGTRLWPRKSWLHPTYRQHCAPKTTMKYCGVWEHIAHSSMHCSEKIACSSNTCTNFGKWWRATLSIKISPTNVHPLIKMLIEPNIQHCKGVTSGPMMEHLNTTIDDLPSYQANAPFVTTTF